MRIVRLHDWDVSIAQAPAVQSEMAFGFASHLGLFLDIPTIGCAKSRLIGQHSPLLGEAGARVPLADKKGELIGMAIRTKPRCKPLHVSIGHRIDLSSSVEWVLKCVKGYRLPEPTGLAHLASKGILETRH